MAQPGVELNTTFDAKDDDDSAVACRMDVLGTIHTRLEGGSDVPESEARRDELRRLFPKHVSCLVELEQFKAAVDALELNKNAPGVVPQRFKMEDIFRYGARFVDASSSPCRSGFSWLGTMLSH